MSAESAHPPAASPRSADRWILLGSGLLALAPFAAYHRQFARLFWFGDEFDLIDQIDRLGFWRWMWLVFAENFVPVFKLLWGGGLLVFGGSYAAMVALVWLTHALNVALLGRLMRTCGLPWAAVFAAQILFGLTPANLETLGWSVQWSAVLSMTFMLLALDGFFRSPFGSAPVAWGAASALSFSRGVLTGALLAFASIWPRGKAPADRLSRRAAYAAACLLPAIAVGLLIAVLARGNHQHMKGHEAEAAVYAVWYFCINPSLYLFAVESWGWRTVIVLGLLKLSLVAWALLRSQGRQRLLFLLLLAFDLANAVLLGVGRYHTGLATVTSSRYQYASLLGIAPAAGFWLSWHWRRLPGTEAMKRILLFTLLFVIGLSMCQQWSGELEPFTTARGTDSRRVLMDNPAAPQDGVPGIPGLPMVRARDLIAKYRLH